MSLFGTLTTMPLANILRWLAAMAKTGTLRIERDRLSKCVLFHEGRIFGCTSNDPPEKLGHFLLSRGRVTEQQLSEALTMQETSGEYLGAVFVEMGVLSQEELTSHLEAQAAETIYGLFDWDDAVFRFSDDLIETPKAFRVDLDVEDVVVRGLERMEELKRIRAVFPSHDVILRKTSVQLPEEALSNGTVRALYEAISEERSLADLLLHLHASEYLVTKFLYALHTSGVIEVLTPPPADAAENDPLDAGAVIASVEAAVEWAVGSGTPTSEASPVDTVPPTTVASPPPATEPVEAPATPAPRPAASVQAEAPSPAPVAAEAANASTPAPAATAPPEAPMQVPTPAVSEELPDLAPIMPAPEELDLPALDAGAEEPEIRPELLDIPDVFVESSDVEAADESAAFQLRRKLGTARKLMTDGDYERALALLESLVRKHPDEDSLRKLVTEAEASFVDKAYRHYVPAAKIPVLARPLESLSTESFTPSEFFLMSRIDGNWDVKSIVQIAPLREVDVLITLKRLRENGVVEFRDPGSD